MSFALVRPSDRACLLALGCNPERGNVYIAKENMTILTFVIYPATPSSALELALSEHAAHDRLARIYNPSILARADLLGQDITHFLGLKPSEDWKSHPSVSKLLSSPPSALTEYVERIRSLGRDDNSLPSFKGYTYPPPPAQSWLLLAHAYVRYLGDLNGGQTLKLRVAKAYDLDPVALDGLRFFEFDGRDGAIATPAELSRLSGAFKKGMDATGEELTPSERGESTLFHTILTFALVNADIVHFSFTAAFLQEANHAFELNMRLFTSFEKDGDVSATLAPGAAQMPAPSSEKFAKASTYMERRAPAISNTPTSTAIAKKSILPVSPGLLFLAIALPLYLIGRLYLPGYLGWE